MFPVLAEITHQILQHKMSQRGQMNVFFQKLQPKVSFLIFWEFPRKQCES